MKDLDGCESDESGAQPFSSFEAQGYNCCCHALLNMVTCVLFAEHSTISSSYLIASINQCKTITVPPASDNVTSEARQFDLPRQYQSTRGVRRIGFRPIDLCNRVSQPRHQKCCTFQSLGHPEATFFLFYFLIFFYKQAYAARSIQTLSTLFFAPLTTGNPTFLYMAAHFFPPHSSFGLFCFSQKGSVQGRLRGEKKRVRMGFWLVFCWVYKTYQVALMNGGKWSHDTR